MTKRATTIATILTLFLALNSTALAKAPVVEKVLRADGSTRTLSALVHEQRGTYFWSLTDASDNSTDWKLFLYRLRAEGDRARVDQMIPIQDKDGRHLTGADLDMEDLTIAPDGTFWAADEHGPWIVHIDHDGTVLEIIEAPAKYKDRRQGQGFEGASISPDGKTLYVMLQSGLSTQKDFTLTWILAYDIETGTFTEWSYQLERPEDYDYTPDIFVRMGSSGIHTLPNGDLLVLERDNLAPPEARVKRIYRAKLPPGGGEASKTLVADLLALGYPHEKAEGMAVVLPSTIVIANDNDADPDIPTELWFIQADF